MWNSLVFSRFRNCWRIAGTLVVVVCVQQAAAQEAAPARSWTLEEAVEHLEMYPNDAYLQYVTLQLARRENLQREYGDRIREILDRGRPDWRRRNDQVNLFSLFTGTLAVQESLQLEVMAGAPVNSRERGDGLDNVQADQPATVAVASLVGPSTKSHPWKEMLAGQQPQIDPLARFVPEDQFYIRFGSISKLLDLISLNEDWGAHLLSQTGHKAYASQVHNRLMTQLALETNELLKPFYDLVVSEMAATGNDLYFTRGSDVTLLFKYQQPAVFHAQMNAFLHNATQSSADAVREQDVYRGIKFTHLGTPDRRVHVFAADLGDNLHIRSNSLVGLKSVIDTHLDSEKSDAVVSLAESTEFAYIRTLMPLADDAEDGFIYLSDPFIRRLTGPELKLTEMRRFISYNHLRMLSHAAALYESEMGKRAESIEDLIRTRCLPEDFGRGRLACPSGGRYELDETGTVGVCSHHGRIGGLRPCCEILEKAVTPSEAEMYQQFVTSYERYWRTYFDPIAIRLTVNDDQLEMETIILPLINNSIYQGMAQSLGGDPKPLDLHPIPERNIFSMAFQLDKRRLIEQSGWQPTDPQLARDPQQEFLIDTSAERLRRIGLALHNYHDTHKTFPPVASVDENGKPLHSWRVHLLPFLGQRKLYEKFKLDEPWSSAHNRQLIQEIPDVYSIPGEKSDEGRTAYLAIVGRNTMFPERFAATQMREVTDGTSNTVLIAEAKRREAAIWTQPQDIHWPPANLRETLLGRYGDLSLMLMSDGRVVRVDNDIDDESLRRAVIKNDGQPLQNFGQTYRTRRQRRSTFSLWLTNMRGDEIDERLAYEFVTRGLKDQIGLHVYDSEPTFDFQLTRFLGQMMSSFSRRTRFDNDFIPAFMLVASFNSPVYASIPIDDVEVTDRFLEHLDEIIAPIARRQRDTGWFRIDNDFYTLPIAEGVTARTESLSIGPVKWRFFWARIGQQLYIASKPEVLEDLARLAAQGATGGDPESAAHAIVRIRPDNWNQTLNNFQLGWAESHRLACLDNVGRLSSLAKLADGSDSIESRPNDLYGVRFYCPCGGHYLKDDQGRVRCSIHGTAYQPHQGPIDQQQGSIRQVLNEFGGMTIKLTFLEDGLHAKLTVDRKPDRPSMTAEKE